MKLKEINHNCFWVFIEKYYPQYYSCNDILLSDILTRKINGETICNDDEEMIKTWDIKSELSALNEVILSKALKNYMSLTKNIK